MFNSNSINADVQYKGMLNHIITTGVDTSDGEVRPVWEDGSSAFTIKAFSCINHYDLRLEFPILTCRKIFAKSAIDEILWIYQSKSNKLSDINSGVWQQWGTPDENGELTIGRTYGWQVRNKLRKVKTTLKKIKSINPNYASTETDCDKISVFMLDQMDYVLHEIMYNPYSRRIIINLYGIEDLPYMNLDPCCHELIFNVTKDIDGNKVLNMQLNQRSFDTVVAGGWDVVSHSALLMMIAQVTGCIAGEFIHNITDAHIYDKHIDLAKMLVDAKTYNSPTVYLDKTVTNFYDFTTSSFTFCDYKYNVETTIAAKGLPVAK